MWDQCGISQCGINVGSVWDQRGIIAAGSIAINAVWDQCGFSVVESVWNQFWISVGPVWDPCGLGMG